MHSAALRTALSFLCFFLAMPNSVCGADKQVPLTMVFDRGSMKEMYKDNAAGKIKLSELRDLPHLYALGPLSGLRGEILVWDSLPFESRIDKGQVQIKSDWDESAAFLVWSSVPAWRKIRVPESVSSLELLDSWLSSLSGPPGAPLPSQFPFLLKGNFSRIFWHIVNAKDDGRKLTPEKHQESKFRGQAKNLNAEMLGFYSPAHQGYFIPSGRRSHLHFRTIKSDYDVLAHVDEFDPKLDSQLTLYVPRRK